MDKDVVVWEGQKFFSVGRMAKDCGVSASYLRAEIARKKLPAYRDQRGWLFVSEDTISKFKSRREKRFVPA